MALPAVRCKRRAWHGSVLPLRRRNAAQLLLLCALRVAIGDADRVVRALPEAQTALGYGVGTLSLWLAAGQAGDALQIWW